MSLIPGVGNFSGLRTVRILRPLKTMTAVPGMKTIVNFARDHGKYGVRHYFGSGTFHTFWCIRRTTVYWSLRGTMLYLDQSAIDDDTGGWLQDDMQGGLCGSEVFQR